MGAGAPVIAVIGLWHLGCVTAACLAGAGHEVAGADPDAAAVEKLRSGRAPFFEPGLDALLAAGLASGRLRFGTDVAAACAAADVIWLATDTPVDDEDRADVEAVVRRALEAARAARPGAVVIVSSQVPAGTTARIAAAAREARGAGDIAFACMPENLRLGKAIEVFTKPDRVVAGADDPRARAAIERVLAPLGPPPVEWMSVASAEMTKHAINAFLATSIVFMNELSALCEGAGADAKEVERGLKTDARIGPRAYLAPGPAIGGGTLLRDIGYLADMARERRPGASDLFAAVRDVNREHAGWARRALLELVGPLAGRSVGLLGLAYKPGTDVVRRSPAVELCGWLLEQGAAVRAHDPKVRSLPGALGERVGLVPSPAEAARGADALVVSTPWPEYAALDVDALLAAMARPVVIDPFRTLPKPRSAPPALRYAAIGAPRA